MEFLLRVDNGIGLRPGVAVTFAGMPVGSVEAVDLTANDEVELTLAIEPRFRDHIRHGARGDAVYTLEGKVVDIQPGPKDAAVLPSGEHLEQGRNFDPILGLQQTDLATTLERIAKILGDIEAISARLDLGEGRIPDALDRLLVLVEDLEAGRGTIGGLLRDDSTLRSTQAALDGVVRSTTSVETLSVQLGEASARIESASTAIEALSGKLGDTAARMDATATNVDRTLESLPLTLDRLNTSMEELTITLRAIQQMPVLKGKVERAREDGP